MTQSAAPSEKLLPDVSTDANLPAVKPDGRLHARGMIEVRRSELNPRTGRYDLVRSQKVYNTLTLGLQALVPNLLAQRSVDGDPDWGQIFSMRVGTGNAPAQRTDFNLAVPLLSKLLGDANKVSTLPGEIGFTMTLEKGEGDGNIIREVCLCTRGNTTNESAVPGPPTQVDAPRMIGRQVIADEPKTPTSKLDLIYRIAFTVE